MKVALFSTYNTTNFFNKNVIVYLIELIRHFDKVVVLTNIERNNIKHSHINFLNDNDIELMQFSNFGYDFGMYKQYLERVDANAITQLGLFNDSCLLLSSLQPFMTWFETSNIDYGGITDSNEHSYHIQSYALLLNASIVQLFINYLMTTEITNDKNEIIHNFEIGFSTHVLNNNFKLDVLYKVDTYDNVLNMSYEKYLDLINNKCPLIKNSVIKQSTMNRREIKKIIQNYQRVQLSNCKTLSV